MSRFSCSRSSDRLLTAQTLNDADPRRFALGSEYRRTLPLGCPAFGAARSGWPGWFSISPAVVGVRAGGLEPPTNGLRGRCSATRAIRANQRRALPLNGGADLGPECAPHPFSLSLLSCQRSTRGSGEAQSGGIVGSRTLLARRHRFYRPAQARRSGTYPVFSCLVEQPGIEPSRALRPTDLQSAPRP